MGGQITWTQAVDLDRFCTVIGLIYKEPSGRTRRIKSSLSCEHSNPMYVEAAKEVILQAMVNDIRRNPPENFTIIPPEYDTGPLFDMDAWTERHSPVLKKHFVNWLKEGF